MRLVLGLDPSSTSEADRSLLDRNLPTSCFCSLSPFCFHPTFAGLVQRALATTPVHPQPAAFARCSIELSSPRAIPLHSRVGNRRSIARSTGLPPGFTLTVVRMDGRIPRGPRGAIIWRRLSPAYLFIYNSMPSPASSQQSLLCSSADVKRR